MREEWRPVVGWERAYAVSNEGRIKSIARMVSSGTSIRRVKEIILIPENHYRGYHRVCLVDRGRREKLFIHRLVADAWLDPAHTTDVVNHKNGVKTDNRLENLEWATFKENSVHYQTFLRPERVPVIPVDEPYTFDPKDLPW